MNGALAISTDGFSARYPVKFSAPAAGYHFHGLTGGEVNFIGISSEGRREGGAREGLILLYAHTCTCTRARVCVCVCVHFFFSRFKFFHRHCKSRTGLPLLPPSSPSLSRRSHVRVSARYTGCVESERARRLAVN